MAKKFAVIGNPIEHSRSPQLHYAFAQRLGIQLDYQKQFAALDAFEPVVLHFFAQQGFGLNITVPFKEQAFAMCNVLTERANIAKAVNTLWMENNQIHGDNTDGQGLVEAILALNWPLKDTSIMIIGAGGATRGVIYPLLQAGVKKITIANRSLPRAEQLVADLTPLAVAQQAQLEPCLLSEMTGDYELIINATSASLTGETLLLPASLKFQYAYEMAYGKASDFLEQAEQRGAKISDGYGMLVGQAAEAFAVWHGQRPEVKEFLDYDLV